MAMPPNSLVRSLLPSPEQMAADIKRMVDFGPRHTGSDAHNNFVGWMAQELKAADCSILPYDEHSFERWLAEDYSLEIVSGPAPGPVRVASYYPYGGETPPEGVVGKLVSQEMVSLGGAAAKGAILLIDTRQPVGIPEGLFAAWLGVTYMHWPDHMWIARHFKRMVAAAGVSSGNTSGAVAAVFILDASFDACAGHYAPYLTPYQGFPALYVDRDTGAALTKAAHGGATARLVMTADKRRATSPSVVAILPGAGSTSENIIVNTHTDGPNFIEENGAVALVALARYFSALPRDRRLSRSLVFSGVTGHFAPGLPQTDGFIKAHPDLVERAAAAFTVEHFGASEWWDDSDGYHATGFPEFAWTYHAKTGGLRDLVTASIKQHDLLHHATCPVPALLGVGEAFEKAGIPSLCFIAGPNYLVSTGKTPADGHLDKLDPALAAAQTAWIADLITRVDGMSKDQLRAPSP